MMRIATAGAAYWAIVFALGFVLGTVRVLWVAPMIGVLPATALELPVMLGASWWASGWLLQRFALRRPGAALAAGAFAFALLMAAECTLAVTMMGETAASWIAGLREPHAALGLAGQIAFALMPWWKARRAV